MPMRNLFGDDPIGGDSDPFGGGGLFKDPLDGVFGPGGGRKRAKFPAAAPAVAEAAKPSLVDQGLSGLHYIGSALDKPGRAVRGALTGNYRELGAAVPFSDSMGLTDPKQQVSGEGVLEHYGLMDPLKPGEAHPGFFSGRNLKGLAASIALDPLTYATFGGSALTGSGKAAKAAGATRGWSHADLIRGFDHTTDALSAAGHSADEIAHMARSGQRVAPAGLGVEANQPLSGLVGFGLPFGETRFTLGHGRASQAIAGTFDSAKDAIKYAPGVRTARQWFDTRAGRSSHAIAQKANETAGAPLRESLVGQNGVWEYGVRKQLDDLMRSDPALKGHEMEGLNLVRAEAEKVASASSPAAWQADFARRIADGVTPGVADPGLMESHILGNFGAYQGIGRDINQRGKGLIEQGRHYGADPRVLADTEAEYARRQYVAGAKGTAAGKARPQQVFGTGGLYDAARQDLLKDVPGGANSINRWAIDPRLSGPARTLAPDQVQDTILNEMFNVINDGGRFHTLTPEVRATLEKKAGGLTDMLATLDPIHAAKQVPFYHPDVVADYVARANAHAKVVGSASASVEGLAGGAMPISAFQTGKYAGQAHVPLDEALARVGLTTHRPWAPTSAADQAHLGTLGFSTPEEARELVIAATRYPKPGAYAGAKARIAGMDPGVRARLMMKGYDGGAARLYEQMARHGAPLQDLKTGAFDPEAYLKGYAVHERDVHALSEYMNGFTTPHEVGPFLGHLDSLQNLFKAMTYPIWPAAHVRNAMSALYNNFIHGTPWDAYRDAFKIMRGHGLDHARYPGLSHTMAPGERAHYLTGLAYGHAGVGTGGSFNEVSRSPALSQIDTLSGTPHNLTPNLPLSGRATPGGSFAGDTARLMGSAVPRPGKWEQWNPLNARGVGGRTDDAFAPLVAGRKTGENIEDFVRMANFLGNLKKGMAPDVAGALTKKVHFDYGDLTSVESNYLRKMVPFYTFMRKNAPAQAQLLAERPSAIAPTIKATTGGPGNTAEDYTPEYLASGPAIRMGHVAGKDGVQNTRFLTSTGLPFEEAMERLKFKDREILGHKVSLPDLIGTARGYVGMMNPYFKAPLEMMTNTQLHTGRQLSDLYKPTPWNLNGAIDGPVGDFLSEVGQNTPFSRFGTTFRKLNDERKSLPVKLLDFFTGVKVSDVDTTKAYNIEARRALEERMAADPRMARFTNYYVKPGADVDPELSAQMGIYSRMQREAQDAAKQRKLLELRKKWGLEGGGSLMGGTVPGL